MDVTSEARAFAGNRQLFEEEEEALLHIAQSHPCADHELFAYLNGATPDNQMAAALLRNYDAHASALRRLLLKAATLMPEPAVGFILENVRNEYGNGNYAGNHQDQLRSLAHSVGIAPETFEQQPIQPGVRTFIRQATQLYFPVRRDKQVNTPEVLYRPAIAAGAITGTELLAIKEFKFLQKVFARRGQEHHLWFHHVWVEEEHFGESLALARYFIEHHHAFDAVEYGLRGIFNANLHLYDGLLAAATGSAAG